MARPATAPPERHGVQVYGSEAFLVQRVATFLKAAPAAGRIVIATAAHRTELARQVDPARLTLLDAEDTLGRFMVGGVPDGARFEQHVGALVRQAAQQGPVRLFGEMVALLAQSGNFAAALQLEGMWNALLADVDAALLCAYPASLFRTAHGKAALSGICDTHAAADLLEALPADPLLASAVRVLQERSNALTLEVARRAQAEQELADFVENAIEGLHRVGPDGTILWANQAELDLLGYSRQEYIGRPVTEFHADPRVIDDMLGRLRRGEAVRDQDARLRCKDGSLRHVRITSNSRMQDGRLVYTRCFTRDVTDRVQLLEERRRLLDSARLQGEVLEAVTDGYMQVDRDWRITFANVGTAFSSQSQPGPVGKVLWEAFPTLAGTVFEKEFREAMQARESRVFEAYHAPTDTWYEGRLFPAGDGLAVYYRDVTAKRHLKRQMEARNRQHAAVARLGQLALSERELCRVLDQAVREAAQAVDVEFCKILQLRPGGDLLLRAGTGWRPGLVGTLTIAPGLESQAGCTLQSGGSVIATDLSTETRFHPTPLLVEHGVVSGMGVAIDGPERPYGVLSVHTAHRRDFNEDDIHFLQSIAHLLAAAIERNHVEAQLQQHRESLEAVVAARTGDLREAVRELEAFSYTVSHDLRTPLRAIDGYSRLLLLRNADRLGPEAHQMLEAIGDQAIRMGRLIESILALSRIGRAELDRKPLDLSGMATEILRHLAQSFPERRVAWTVDPGLVAEGDQELVRLTLENLLGNAWKFTSRTEAARIRLHKAGDAFCVEDNGAGFDMAHAGQLFQPFHRLHATSEFDGTGIGLATVARIVRRHGGRIWAEARPGKGAQFHFQLAQADEEDRASPPVMAAGRAKEWKVTPSRPNSSDEPLTGRGDSPAGEPA